MFMRAAATDAEFARFRGGVRARIAWLACGLAPLLLALSCGGGLADDTAPAEQWDNLEPVPNTTSDQAPQPLRAHPFAVALTPDGGTALVTLRGSEIEPVGEVAVIDVARRTLRSRITVGDRPVAIAIHPDGDLAVVLSHLSPYAAVIDVAGARVTSKLRVGYYAQDLVLSPDGGRMFVTNRATDELQEWELTRSGSQLTARVVAAVPAGTNPDAVALSPDGQKLYVADLGGLGIRVFDTSPLAASAFIFFNAPVLDIEAMGAQMIATTLNDTDGLPCEDDADYPGVEGDGIFPRITDRTCSRGFADIQNEIAFIDVETDQISVRYTSDTAEVSEADREGSHPAALQKVVGALPYSIFVLAPDHAYVTMGASFEVVEVSVDATNASAPPAFEVLRTLDTGFAPRGVAASSASGSLVVANMLGDSVSIYDVTTGERTDVSVAKSADPFPSTSAEIGELFFNSARFSTDGDQSCSHCHPDGGSDGKSWGIALVRAFGRRATIPTRNLQATKPLLIEGVFDETDFRLEIEGTAFRPDFHDSSYTLQVQRRDEFFRSVSRDLIGREISFEAMVLHLADFLVAEPRLLPSPFDKTTPQVDRGRALFFRIDVACATCHPSPAFASPESFLGITTMGRFDRPRRDIDPDSSLKFLENARDGFFNANTLRGLWDRRGALFHDGRARTARETLLTPGHECLRDGEIGFNENNGQPDTHGGISHLTCDEIDDLVAFLLTID